MANYHIKHITRYTYASTVTDSINQIMLYPVNDAQQVVNKHELKITNNPILETFTDYFGNIIGVFSNITPQDSMTIESDIDLIVNMPEVATDAIAPEVQWGELEKMKDTVPLMDFIQRKTFAGEEEIKKIVTGISDTEKTPLINALVLSEYVYTNFEYKKGVTNVETEVEDILKLKAGVCQDFAHVLLVMLRTIGIPGRYVSGYICPKNHELRGEGATHAWVEAYIPFFGWLGMDPTNNCIVTDRHVRLAVGTNFTNCSPVKGTYKGSSEHTLDVSVSIDNGHVRTQEERDNVPVFSYTTKNPGVSENSYRKYQEIQQQQ